ncbi:MAG: PGF-pre-PGF domain-containing protein, partial [archaeon]
DKTVPTIVVDSVTPATIYNNDTVVFRINVTDVNVNTSNVFLSSNFSGSWANYNMNSESSSVFNYSLSGTSNLTNQKNIAYRFFATDLAGNSNQSAVFNFTVQNRNISSVSVVSPANNSVLELGNSTLFNNTATDSDGDNLTYVWNISDGTDETNASFNKSFSSEGTFEINLTVSDPYGSSLSTSISVVVNDSTAPTIDDIDYDSAVHISSDVNQTVSVDVSDLSNVSSIKLYYNGSLVTASSSNATYATWTWGNFSVGDDYNFTIELIDDSSNNNAENTTYTFDVDSCSDSAKNGDETATDCGGSCSACDGGGGGGGGGSGTTISSTSDEEEIVETVDTTSPSSSSGRSTNSGSTDPTDSTEDFTETSGPGTSLQETETTTRGASEISETVNFTGKESMTLKFNDPRISIEEIEIKTGFVGEVNITIRSFDSSPSGLGSIEGAYQYFEIDFGNLSNDDIKKVKFTFNVERTWLNAHGYSEKKVKLNTYSDSQWEELSTDLVSSDIELVTYQADVNHLSFFAITAEPSKNIFSNLFGFTGLSAKQNLLIVLFVLVLGLGVAYYFLRPKGG